jgi:hypothetical protein
MGYPETPNEKDSILSDWFRSATHAAHMHAHVAESLRDQFCEPAAEVSTGY